MKEKQIDFNPHARAFTGGVGKPTKDRRNDGRPIPWSPLSVSYGTRLMPRASSIFNKLEPYANNKPPSRVVFRAPEGLTPEERKRYHKLRKEGLI